MAALRRRSARAPVVGRRCVAFLRTGAGINWQTRPGRLDWRKLCAENCAPMNALIFSNLALMLVSYSPLASGGPVFLQASGCKICALHVRISYFDS